MYNVCIYYTVYAVIARIEYNKEHPRRTHFERAIDFFPPLTIYTAAYYYTRTHTHIHIQILYYMI